MRRALNKVLAPDEKAIKPKKRPNQYTKRLSPGERCQCNLTYVAASTTVMIVSSLGKENQTYKWHSVFPTKTNAAIVLALIKIWPNANDCALRFSMRATWRTSGRVEYTSTYTFVPTSAIVTVVDNHEGHGPLCKSKDSAETWNKRQTRPRRP